MYPLGNLNMPGEDGASVGREEPITSENQGPSETDGEITDQANPIADASSQPDGDSVSTTTSGGFYTFDSDGKKKTIDTSHPGEHSSNISGRLHKAKMALEQLKQMEYPTPLNHEALATEIQTFNSGNSVTRIEQNEKSTTDNSTTSYTFFKKETAEDTDTPILLVTFDDQVEAPTVVNFEGESATNNENQITRLQTEIASQEEEYPELHKMLTQVLGSIIRDRNNGTTAEEIPMPTIQETDHEDEGPVDVTNSYDYDSTIPGAQIEYVNADNSPEGPQRDEDVDAGTPTYTVPDYTFTNSTADTEQSLADDEPAPIDPPRVDNPPPPPGADNPPPRVDDTPTPEQEPTPEEIAQLEEDQEILEQAFQQAQREAFDQAYTLARSELDDAPEKTGGFKNWARKIRKVIETSTSLAGGFATGFVVKSVVTGAMVSAGIATGGIAPIAAAVIAGAGAGAIKNALFGGLLHYRVFHTEQYAPFAESRKKEREKHHKIIDTENRMNSLVNVYNHAARHNVEDIQNSNLEDLGLTTQDLEQAYTDYLVLFKLTRFAGVNDYPTGEQGFVKAGDRDLTAAEAIAEMGEILPRLLAANNINVEHLIERSDSISKEKYQQLRKSRIKQRISTGAKFGALGGFAGSIIGNIIETGQAFPGVDLDLNMGFGEPLYEDPGMISPFTENITSQDSIIDDAWNLQKGLLERAGIDPSKISVDGMIDTEEEMTRLSEAISQIQKTSTEGLGSALEMPANSSWFSTPEGWKSLATQEGWRSTNRFAVDRIGGAYGIIQGEVTKTLSDAGVTAESFGSEAGFKAWTELVKARVAEAGIDPTNPTASMSKMLSFSQTSPIEPSKITEIINKYGLETTSPYPKLPQGLANRVMEQIRDVAEASQNKIAEATTLAANSELIPDPNSIAGLTEEQRALLSIPEIRKHLSAGIRSTLKQFQELDIKGQNAIAIPSLATAAAVTAEMALPGANMKGTPNIPGRNGMNQLQPGTDNQQQTNPTGNPRAGNGTATRTPRTRNRRTNATIGRRTATRTTTSTGTATTGTTPPQGQARPQILNYELPANTILRNQSGTTIPNLEDTNKEIQGIEELLSQYNQNQSSQTSDEIAALEQKVIDQCNLRPYTDQDTNRINPAHWGSIKALAIEELERIGRSLSARNPDSTGNTTLMYPTWNQARVNANRRLLDALDSLFNFSYSNQQPAQRQATA